ncbi:hypothetical protein EVAR_50628_1 [Eumeta japonica]|uniref:Secreted protein n=1 Tax=Eumeta variegata TaxID=151549 RepID=A0A4C1XKJ2_EUMVA|nr:hypothetical protein EVAR_50628_1 [Eumeta japonica]
MRLLLGLATGLFTRRVRAACGAHGVNARGPGACHRLTALRLKISWPGYRAGEGGTAQSRHAARPSARGRRDRPSFPRDTARPAPATPPVARSSAPVPRVLHVISRAALSCEGHGPLTAPASAVLRPPTQPQHEIIRYDNSTSLAQQTRRPRRPLLLFTVIFDLFYRNASYFVAES